MTAFCCLCGNTDEADLGQVTGICLDAEACHRRQALASLESATFHVETPEDRLRERMTSPTFAMTGKTAEEVLFGRPGQGGTLTPELIGRALDELRRPLLAGSFEVSGTIALEFFPGAAEALLEMLRPRCGALLFPLPARAPIPVEPVHPLDAPYFAPVQGPQPAACALDEGHRIGWHWCDGTWWKA